MLNYAQLVSQFEEFRQQVYNCFESYRDSCMDLLDALAGNTGSKSIVELSLSPLFPRSYNSIYQAIQGAFNTTSQKTNQKEETEGTQETQGKEDPNKIIMKVVSGLIEAPQQRPFYLFGIDTTPQPRPYAKTLAERKYIYQPNTIKGNKPINIGHSYSILSILPEKEVGNTAPWTVPISAQRVPVKKTSVDLGHEQIEAAMSDSSLPWHNQLCLLVGDTDYSQRSFLFKLSKHKNLVVVARVRSNRVFYQSPPPSDQSNKKPGCPKKYGERFDLGDPDTWHEPNETTRLQQTTRKGRLLKVTIQAWHQTILDFGF